MIADLVLLAVAASVPAAPPRTLTLDEVVAARPELAVLAGQLRAQELTVRAVRGAYAPSAFVSPGVTDAGEELNTLTWNWSAAVGITVPLFQGGQTKAQVHEAEANLASIKAQVDAERQQVGFEIEQARLAVRAAKASLEASGDALSNAQARFQLAEGRYQAGVGSIIELGDAQVAPTTAAQEKVQAEYCAARPAPRSSRRSAATGAGRIASLAVGSTAAV